MADKEIIIDGVDVSKCNYAILPKKQCPMQSMPYAKETSCIACKEHNTKRNFCKNNPNCYFKQLKRKEQALDEIEDIADDYNRVEKTSQYYRDGFDQIQDIINKAKEQISD